MYAGASKSGCGWTTPPKYFPQSNGGIGAMYSGSLPPCASQWIRSGCRRRWRWWRPAFPSMFVSLHRGLFWYYLEQLPEPPQVRPDSGCPLIHMTSRGAGDLRPAGIVLSKPNCGGVFSLHHRWQWRPGVSQNANGCLCLPCKMAGRSSRELACWTGACLGPGRVGGQLPEGGGTGLHESPGGKRLPHSGEFGGAGRLPCISPWRP